LADIVIVGAGIGGLGAALILGRQGRRVVVCERDPALVPGSSEEMWSAWPRPGTPQARLGHGFYPGFRLLLQEHAPDVLQRLWDTGAPPLDWTTRMPGDERRPEDGELTGFMCRRPVVEGILRQAVEAEPTVQVRAGCSVAGLLAASSPLGGIPRVVGVRTKDQGEIAADSVVVAGGGRLPIQRWLEEIGAQPPAEEAEGCGFHWYARHFRLHLRPGEDHTVMTPLTTGGDLRWLKYVCWGTDQGTFCVEFGVPIWEHALHALRDDAVFMAVVRAMPEWPAWLDPERCTPIQTVAVMGQEHNRLRQFIREGHPLALGLHVIGDTRCQTNSAYGWGAGLAFAEAVVLADVLAEWPGDAVAQTAAFEARLGEEIAGRYRLSSVLDRACLRAYRGEPAWDAGESSAGFRESVVVPAGREDAEVFRAVRRRHFQLDPVDALAGNSAVHERARQIAATKPSAPPQPSGPTREEVLQIIAAARL
jgi:2-polyprenyl-6-methoxyphenol hydroxylase-like FAD-dependent oxidoreductase